jgi:hypothetical protein
MALPKSSFNIQLQGFTPANRDAVVTLVNQATGEATERRPFLDGTLLVRDLDPGNYEVTVSHPNLLQPIDQRVVRLFPQPFPTLVPIPVPADLFRDTPIRDVPDVDLGPVQQTIAAARSSLRPLVGKSPGEAIRAEDWNALAGAVADLAGAVSELSSLVSPRGHDHPEIAEKIGEVQDNIRRFAEAFGRSLLELRREIETETIRRTATEVLDLGGASEETRIRVLGRIDQLAAATQSDTPLFTQRLSTAGTVLLTEVNNIALGQGAAADAFLANPEVQRLSEMARAYSDAGTQTRPEGELLTYQRTGATAGGQKLTRIIGG